MRILATGSQGFVGRHVRAEAVARGHVFHGIDHHESEYRGDVRDFIHLAVTESRPDVVLHLAAYVGRAACEASPRKTVRENVELSVLVGVACAEAGVPVAYTSTSEVYGDRGRVRVSESDQPFPTSGIYGMTKLWAEQALEHLAPDGLLIMRPCMLYGPGMPVGPGWAALPTFVFNALHGERITVHKGAERSWCWVDLEDGIQRVADSMRALV